jgi:methionyl-tRNA formyltransferase
MKLAKAMDAGPIYWQTTLKNLPLCKDEIYKALATTGAEWIADNLGNLSKPVLQDESRATFCGKLTREMGLLKPETETAEQVFRKIVAYAGYPKAKYTFFGINCIILEAHILKPDETAFLTIPCADGGIIAVDRLQPEGRKAMDAKSFVNGYGK